MLVRQELSYYRTPLLRLPSLERLFARGDSKIYAKYEGVNPTGTHKDRAAALHVQRALEGGFRVLTAGTCGNFGVSLAYYSRMVGAKAVIFVPRRYTLERMADLRRYGAQLVFVDGSYEDAVERSVRAASDNGWYDANPGSSNTSVNFEAYSALAYEIAWELGDPPTAVALPVGNGTTLAGVHMGFKRLKDLGYIESVPRMIGVTTVHGNSAIDSFLSGRDSAVPTSSVKETKYNEPLVSMISFDGDAALRALRESGGGALRVPDRVMLGHSRLLRELEGIDVLPASASVVEALRSLDGGTHVLVLTSRWHLP
ncbi:MAG: pyridoxal-phosphate dependent enzyme [Conexivisphaera sp.]|jgi:threonine synthase